jgi:hypothetical protein
MSLSEQKSIRPRGLSTSLLLCMVLLFPLRLLGAEQSDAPVPQPDTSVPQQATPAPLAVVPVEQPDLFTPIDAPHDYLSGKIVSFATDIDRFFGNDRNYQESNKSVVQLALGRASGYGGNGKLVLAARANLNLPSTEKRLHLLVESNPDQNITGEPPQSQQTTPLTNNIDKPQSFGLALRYEKVKEELKALHLSADAGLKFQGININPFVRARGSYSVPMDQWRLKAEESVYWFNTIGAGETTQIDLEHLLSEPVLFRATSNATWLHDKQNFDLRQDLSIYHTVSDRTALLYQASVVGVSNPQVEVSEYILSILYRYRLHREWIFFSLNPQLVFPKVNDFNPSFALNIRLEMMFDESK